MNTAPRPRVLVVEDEPGIADTIAYALSTDGFEPRCVATGADALAHFAAAPPVLAILDVGLPDMNGFELFRHLQALPGGAATPMLFLTARSSEIDRVVGLELGADDYVAKPFSPRELVARVRTILRRSARAGAADELPAAAPADTPPAAAQAAPYAVLRHGFLECDTERRQMRYHGQALELSRYEFGLLATLMQRPGRVFTRDELLERVWDDPGESFDRTVDAHVKTVRAKLRAVREDDDPIRTLRGVGYALRD
ncbi:MAG: two-component system response regulator CreB [Pseudomonadota bacterium]|nr:two-component system response regulator CreB [Pseudomonadota bacterium]